jgi:hypothetical protein
MNRAHIGLLGLMYQCSVAVVKPLRNAITGLLEGRGLQTVFVGHDKMEKHCEEE